MSAEYMLPHNSFSQGEGGSPPQRPPEGQIGNISISGSSSGSSNPEVRTQSMRMEMKPTPEMRYAHEMHHIMDMVQDLRGTAGTEILFNTRGFHELTDSPEEEPMRIVAEAALDILENPWDTHLVIVAGRSGQGKLLQIGGMMLAMDRILTSQFAIDKQREAGRPSRNPQQWHMSLANTRDAMLAKGITERDPDSWSRLHFLYQSEMMKTGALWAIGSRPVIGDDKFRIVYMELNGMGDPNPRDLLDIPESCSPDYSFVKVTQGGTAFQALASYPHATVIGIVGDKKTRDIAFHARKAKPEEYDAVLETAGIRFDKDTTIEEYKNNGASAWGLEKQWENLNRNLSVLGASHLDPRIKINHELTPYRLGFHDMLRRLVDAGHLEVLSTKFGAVRHAILFNPYSKNPRTHLEGLVQANAFPWEACDFLPPLPAGRSL